MELGKFLIEIEISDISNLTTKAALNTKATEIENEIHKTITLVKKTN